MGKEIDFTLVPANAGMFELTQDTGVGARWRHDFWCTRLAAVFRDLATHRKSAGFAEAMSRLRRQNEEGRPSADSAIARR
jgi:hypothetical protein